MTPVYCGASKWRSAPLATDQAGNALCFHCQQPSGDLEPKAWAIILALKQENPGIIARTKLEHPDNQSKALKNVVPGPQLFVQDHITFASYCRKSFQKNIASKFFLSFVHNSTKAVTSSMLRFYLSFPTATFQRQLRGTVHRHLLAPRQRHSWFLQC